MTDAYCRCDPPVIDVDHDAACRRCGLPVQYASPHGWLVRMADGSLAYLAEPEAG
jgi:hypothetical protein